MASNRKQKEVSSRPSAVAWRRAYKFCIHLGWTPWASPPTEVQTKSYQGKALVGKDEWTISVPFWKCGTERRLIWAATVHPSSKDNRTVSLRTDKFSTLTFSVSVYLSVYMYIFFLSLLLFLVNFHIQLWPTHTIPLFDTLVYKKVSLSMSIQKNLSDRLDIPLLMLLLIFVFFF